MDKDIRTFAYTIGVSLGDSLAAITATNGILGSYRIELLAISALAW